MTTPAPRIEKTFSVAVPLARAWAAFADSHERAQWEAEEYAIDPRPGGHIRWTLPGMEATGQVEEVVPRKLLRHREGTGPHVSSEITVTFEEEGNGTRITITHAGFGDDEWQEWIEGTSLGWDLAIADLVVYLQTGVAARRFNTGMRSPGMRMRDTSGGVEVQEVWEAGLAADAGLQRGDLLLRVADTPVFSLAELWVLLRQFPAGEQLTVEYIRDSTVHTSKGVLTGWS
jgi:uncharacterized protein YndB with AHSA1/START domain